MVEVCTRDRYTRHEVLPDCLIEALEHAKIRKRVHNLCKVCKPVFFHFLGSFEDHPLHNSKWERLDQGSDEPGFDFKKQNLRSICQQALEGCDGCGLILYCFEWDYTAMNSTHHQRPKLTSKDQITVQLKRWDSNQSRFLIISPYSGCEPWHRMRTELSMAAEPGSSAAPYVVGRVDFGGTESAATLALAKHWLNDCYTSETHDRCDSSETTLPSRVLKVDNGLQLYEPNDGFGRYATLSYCWGGEQPRKLLTTNHATYLAGIVEEDQPKTIRDAIKVTRALSLPFLWIDSYCIVQDSPEDKAIQIAEMAQIYRNSQITIVGANTSTAEEGFLRPTSNLSVMPLYTEFPDGSAGAIFLQYLLSFRCDRRGVYGKDPINRRAWTLQERALSRRLLYFPSGEADVEFQCESSGRCNMNATATEGGDVELNVIGGWSKGVSLHSRISETSTDGSAFSYWNSVVEAYAARQLTEDGDKLAALAGVASEFAAYFGPTYLAGMWERSLVRQLLWITQPSVRRPNTYTGPSWSWASLRGPVKMSDARLFLEQDMESNAPWSAMSMMHFRSPLHHIMTPTKPANKANKAGYEDSLELRIIGHRVELATNDSPFGAVRHAELTVHGSLMHCTIKKSAPEINSFGDDQTTGTIEPWAVWEHAMELSYSTAIGSAILDISTEFPPDGDVYCLILKTLPEGQWLSFLNIQRPINMVGADVQGGLLLTRNSASQLQQNSYKRVGVFHIRPDEKQRFTDAARKETIIIV